MALILVQFQTFRLLSVFIMPLQRPCQWPIQPLLKGGNKCYTPLKKWEAAIVKSYFTASGYCHN